MTRVPGWLTLRVHPCPPDRVCRKICQSFYVLRSENDDVSRNWNSSFHPVPVSREIPRATASFYRSCHGRCFNSNLPRIIRESRRGMKKAIGKRQSSFTLNYAVRCCPGTVTIREGRKGLRRRRKASNRREKIGNPMRGVSLTIVPRLYPEIYDPIRRNYYYGNDTVTLSVLGVIVFERKSNILGDE